MAELQQSFGFKVSYNNALRARNGVISMIYSGLEESFNLLPKYLDVLQKWNPGTITDMDIGEDQRLRHFCVALSVSRAAFATCLRQVIVVDATHLKGRNKGVLLVAVTKDGNEQIFPLAIGFAPIENDESWTWFMSRLRMAFDCSPQLLIVLDQHISIAKAVSSVYPEVTHALCGYHIQNKLATFNSTIVKLYHKAAYAYRSIIYQKAIDQIQEHCPNAYNKLMIVGPEKWAKSKCPVRRYSFMTSNATEVFNSRLLDARRLPICSIIELYRHIVKKWFDERRAKAFARDDDLTEEVVAKLTPLADISHRYTVSPVSKYHFKVKYNDRTWKVDLQDNLCDCREFQMDLIPCSHAIAAIRFKGLGVYDYVWEYYKTSNWRETYGGNVHPLPPRDEWIVSPEA